MRRGWAITNGVLAAASAAVVALGVTSVGDPTKAAAATQQTTTVSRGTVTATVSASGNAAAASNVAVSFQGSGGIVTQIFVKMNQTVKAGQALARVDDTSAKQSLATARANLASAEAQLVTATQGQTSQETARDQSQIRSAQVILTNAQNSVTQAEASRDLDRTQQEARVAAAQKTVDDAKTADAKTQAKSALTTAKQTRDATMLKDQQQIQTAQGQVTSAQATLASQQASAAVDAQPAKAGAVKSANAQIASAKVGVAQAVTTLRQTVLRAPVAGTVAAISGTVGESSSSSGASSSSSSSTSSTSSTSSSSGFITLSRLSTLDVTADVAEADASKIKVGQSASVSFSATNVTATGTVSAIDVQDTVSNNVIEYGVTVRLTGHPTGIKLGQTASVTITTVTKSNALRLATSAITTVGSLHTVTVVRNGKNVTTTVQEGIAGDTSTEIVSGLSQGDVVVIPTSTSAPSGFTFPGGVGGLGGGIGG